MSDDDDPRRASTPRIVSVDGAVWEELGEQGRRLSTVERDLDVVLGRRGQPGALAMLTTHAEAHSKRLAELEQARWKLAGAVMLAGSLTGVILFALSHLIGK